MSANLTEFEIIEYDNELFSYTEYCVVTPGSYSKLIINATYNPDEKFGDYFYAHWRGSVSSLNFMAGANWLINQLIDEGAFTGKKAREDYVFTVQDQKNNRIVQVPTTRPLHLSSLPEEHQTGALRYWGLRTPYATFRYDQVMLKDPEGLDRPHLTLGTHLDYRELYSDFVNQNGGDHIPRAALDQLFSKLGQRLRMSMQR